MAGYHIYGRPFAGSLIAEFLLTEVGEDYTISFPDKDLFTAEQHHLPVWRLLKTAIQ